MMIRTLTLLNDDRGCNRPGNRPASRAWSMQSEDISEAAVEGADDQGKTYAPAGCIPSRQ